MAASSAAWGGTDLAVRLETRLAVGRHGDVTRKCHCERSEESRHCERGAAERGNLIFTPAIYCGVVYPVQDAGIWIIGFFSGAPGSGSVYFF